MHHVPPFACMNKLSMKHISLDKKLAYYRKLPTLCRMCCSFKLCLGDQEIRNDFTCKKDSQHGLNFDRGTNLLDSILACTVWIEYNRPGECVETEGKTTFWLYELYLIIKHKLNHPLSFDKDWDIICYKCSLNCSRSSLVIKLILSYLPTHWCSMPERVVCFVCCCTGGYYTFVCKMTFMPDFLIIFALYGHTVPTLH